MWEWISVHCLPLLVMTEYWTIKHYIAFFKIITHLFFLYSFFCQFIKYATKYIWSFIIIIIFLLNRHVPLNCHVPLFPLIIIYFSCKFTMKIWLEIATVASPIVSVYNEYVSCAVEGLYAVSLTMTSNSDCKWF